MSSPDVIFDFFDSPELLDIQRTGFYNFLKQGIPQLLAKEFPIKVRNGNYSLELSLNEKTVKLITPEDDPRDCILKMKTYNCKLYAQINIVCRKSSSMPYKRFVSEKASYKSWWHVGQNTKRPLFRQVPLSVFGAKPGTLGFVNFGADPHRSPKAVGLQIKDLSAKLCKKRGPCKHLRAKRKEKIVYQSLPEWVLLGQLPIMTKRGHFIINGSPRVIVHQVVRAPGIYFQKLLKKDDQNKARFYGDIIPLKGVWVRLQMTKKGRVEAKFKKGKKVEVELLQKCLQVLENQTFSVSSTGFNKNIECSSAIDRVTRYFSGWPSNRKWSGNAFYRSWGHMGQSSNQLPPLQTLQSFVTPTAKLFAVGQSHTWHQADTNRRFVTQKLGRRFLKKKKLWFLKQDPVEIARWTGTREILKKISRRMKTVGRGLAQRASFVVLDSKPKLCVQEGVPFSSVKDRDARFLLYDEYSTLFDKKKSRAESKAEYDAFVHTYDKLYRTTQDKELEEWQKKKRNQNFFRSSSSSTALESSREKTRFCTEHQSSYRSEICPGKQLCNSFIVPFERDFKNEDLQPQEKKEYQTSCKALHEDEGGIRAEACVYKPNVKRNQALFPVHGQSSTLSSLPENAFKRKKCSENLFATFKVQSRYDLGLLGREKINNKFGLCNNRSCLGQTNILASAEASTNSITIARGGQSLGGFARQQNLALGFGAKPHSSPTSSFWKKSCTARSGFSFQTKKKTSKTIKPSGYQPPPLIDNRNTQLTSFDLCSATLWLYKLRKGEQNSDDIDHSQNRRVRTSGDLLQTQFENGVYRLKNLLSTKLQEWRGDLSSSAFSAIFKFSWKTRYTSNHSFKGAKKAELPYFEKKSLLTALSNCSSFTSNANPRLENAWADRASCKSSCVTNRRFVSALFCFGVCGADPQPHQVQSSAYTNRRFVTQEDLQSTCNPLRSKIRTCVPRVVPGQSNKRFLKDQSTNISHKLSAKELFSTKPITGALREFFGSNPLSQYMDQTNPLAEITHKRRISSLGVGGVSRESAGMAIRGIHPTHYGRICPIETPEGKNAGLVNSLAFYTKIDKDGFLETPYYRVFKGQIQSSLGFSFCSAKEESVTGLQIAPSDLQKSSNNILRTRFSTPESVPVRVADNLLDVFKKENPYKVQLVAISPIQMISVATSLIPFLEHNDANRALMGSNMQRQAVPLMISERPVVGTGLESIVIVESGHITESQTSGFASHVTANKIVIDTLSYKKKEGPCSVSPSLSCFFDGKSPPNQMYKGSMSPLKEATKASLGLLTNFMELGALRTNLRFVKSSKPLNKSLLYKTPLKKQRLVQTITPNLSEMWGFQSFSFSAPPISNRRFVYKYKSYTNLRFVRRVTRHQEIVKICACKTGERLKKANPVTWFRSGEQGVSRVTSSKSKALLPPSRVDALQKKTSKRSSALHAQNKGFYFLRSSFLLRRVERANRKGRCIQKQSCLLSAVAPLTTFARSNQNTCITEKPLIREFDWVQKGDILSDCSASNNGELAVGKNVLLAYIPWEGYNFEDAIVISERLVKEHVYTSLHIERYVFQAQDLKDGNEWFTNHLPGIEPRSIQHLEESGLPKIGSFLKEGDIIVGKIRYLNKKPSSPYERLLCDILGEKNFAARNKSLYVPKGVEARVIYHKVVSVFDNDPENKVRPLKAAKTVHIFLGEKRVIQVGDKISGRHGNKGVISTILPRQDMPYLPDGTPIDIILNPLGVPSRMNVGQVLECLLGLAATYLNQHFKITAFDEKYGVEASKSIVFLKLYQARLQSGQNWLFQVAFPGKTRLVDGRSGECFDQWITVGRAYILKLIHMVSEKIHARSTGPYALITQQPLRGRSNKGGQRLGEMEVWALEGFGAAYTLQELLTKKSDDFFGRKQIVDSILPNPTSIVDTLKPSNRVEQNRSVLGHPEIFKVLLCELQALCLDLGVYIVTPDSFQRTFLGIIH